jgi:isopentenyl-diphosphate delta-isomerase
MTSVDLEDNVIGPIGKAEGHFHTYYESKEALPHRAFSLFLFNESNELLMQQRSGLKITFP